MSSNRIITNTLATYGRSLLALALALFSSRWVLNSLGHSDFGLFNVVGAMIVFVIFLNRVLATSVTRFFSYTIGKGDKSELNACFNTAISIHLLLAVILVAFGCPIGEYAINSFLTIPNDRISSCLWVFRISLVSAFASMASVPYIGMFTAKQKISELALWGVAQTLLSFALAFSLSYIESDRLVFYAGGMASIIVMTQIAQALRAAILFEECKITTREWFSKQRTRSILSFSGWNLIGNAGSVLRDQGTALLLNMNFGTRTNAAYGIATQVSTQVNQLSAAMIAAFTPEITASEGRGDRTRMLSLANQASKFGTILIAIIAIPLMIEMDYILKLWLHTPPEHASIFCRLILATFLIDRTTAGFMLAINAKGSVAAYQATVGGSLFLTLPLAWILVKIFDQPTIIGYAFIATITISAIGRIFWAKHHLQIDSRLWVHGVLRPCLIVIATTLLVAYSMHSLPIAQFVRLGVVMIASISAGLVSLLLTLSTSEKQYARSIAQKRLQKYGLPSLIKYMGN